jgi:hypothetical protein
MKHSLLLFVCLAMGAGVIKSEDVINSEVELFDNICKDPAIEFLRQKKREEEGAVKTIFEAIDSCYGVKNEDIFKLFENGSSSNLICFLTDEQLEQGGREALKYVALIDSPLCKKMADALFGRVKMRERLGRK